MATVVGTAGLPNDLQVVQGTPVEAGPSGSAPPLAEMVARFKRELKLKESMTMADAVGEACTALGVKREGSLIEQAQKCWAVLCGDFRHFRPLVSSHPFRLYHPVKPYFEQN